MTRIAIAVSVLALSGCELATIIQPECSAEVSATQEGRAVLWDGYGYQWEDLSHRISFLRAGTSIPDEDGGFNAQMGILGGDWADGRAHRDRPHFANGHSVLQAEGAGLVAHYGAVEVSVEADGRAVATVELDLDEVGLPEREEYLVGLRGFCFDSDVPLADGYTGDYDPYDGWTPQAFGARIAPAVVDGRGLAFETELRFEAGALDRDDHNRAIPYRRIHGVVQYVVLALDVRSVSRASVGVSVYHRSQGGAHSYIAPVPAEALTVPIDAAAGGAMAFPLLRGWQYVLNEDSDPERRGRYLRAWTARIDSFGYASEDGAGSVTMDMYLSHASTFQEGDLEVKHSGEVDFVVLDDEDATLDRDLVISGMADLGLLDHPVD